MIPWHYISVHPPPRNIMFYTSLDLDLENQSGKCNQLIVFPYSDWNCPNLIFTISVELRLVKNSSLSNCWEYCDHWKQSTEFPSWKLSSTVSSSHSRMSSTSSLSTFSFNSYLLWLVYNYSMESFLPVMTKANTKQKNVSKYFYCYTCTGSISSSWYASLILDSTHNRKTKNVKN